MRKLKTIASCRLFVPTLFFFTLFQGVAYGREGGSSANSFEGKNGYSTGLLSGLYGYQAVTFEHPVFSFLSLEAGAGVTFRSLANDLGYSFDEDYVQDARFIASLSTGLNLVGERYNDYSYRVARLGYCIAFAPKIYLKERVFNSLFVSPEISYKRFRYGANRADESLLLQEGTSQSFRSDEKQGEYMRCIDFTVKIGKAKLKMANTYFSWYFSAGIRHLSANRLLILQGGTTKEDPVMNRKVNATYFKNSSVSYSRLRSYIEAGLKLGLVR